MRRITDSQIIEHADGGSHEQLYCFGHLWGPAYFRKDSADYKEYLSIVQKLKAYEDTGLEPGEIMDGKMLTGWIPVEERLPEIGVPVLITLWDKDVTIGTWYGHRWGTVLCYNEDVLAWMSLPKPFSPQN